MKTKNMNTHGTLFTDTHLWLNFFLYIYTIYSVSLFQACLKHFKTIPVVEKDVLSYFFYTLKSNSNKLDQKNGNMGENT